METVCKADEQQRLEFGGRPKKKKKKKAMLSQKADTRALPKKTTKKLILGRIRYSFRVASGIGKEDSKKAS